MPWCPKCESEYEPWVKVCKTCDAILVDDLSLVKKYVVLYKIKHEEVERAVEFLKYSGFNDIELEEYEEGTEIKVVEEDYTEAKKFLGTYLAQRQKEIDELKKSEGESNTDELIEDELEHINSPQETEISYDKLKEVKSSFTTFLVMGALLLVVGLLSLLDVVSFIDYFNMKIMLVSVGIVFILIAIWTKKKIPVYEKQIAVKENTVKDMVEWFKAKYDVNTFHKQHNLDTETMDEGALYFAASDIIKGLLENEFPDSVKYISSATEEIMNLFSNDEY